MNNIASIPQRILHFLQEVRVEARKANWPTPRETLLNTVIVIAFTVFVAFLLGVFDIMFQAILDKFVV